MDRNKSLNGVSYFVLQGTIILKATFIKKTRLKKEGPRKANTINSHRRAPTGTAAAPGGSWILPQP